MLTLFLHNRSRLGSTKSPDSDMIRQSASWHEDGGLFAKHFRKATFQLLYAAAHRIRVWLQSQVNIRICQLIGINLIPLAKGAPKYLYNET